MSDAATAPSSDAGRPVAPPDQQQPPSTSPGAEGSAQGSRSVQNINLGTVTAESTNIIAEQNVQNNHTVNNLRVVSKYVESDVLSVERPFSTRDAKPFTPKLASELTHTYVGDDGTTVRLLRHLEERRVLLLTGERDVGKRTAALYVGVQLARERSLAGDPLLVDSLERHIGINLRDIAADATGFGKRITVFADAFEQHNTQLRAFFGSADHVGWDDLTELLRRNDAYFIFTATSSSVPFRQQSTDRIAQCELQPLNPELIQVGIEKRLEWMMMSESTARERVALLADHRARIVTELKTLARVVSFLRHFIRDESDLDSSLRRFRDASFWFRTALERDVDAWTFAFTLTLSLPTRDADAAPWADFERIRRAIAERIRGDLELFPRRRRSEAVDEPDFVTPARSFADDQVLEHCRAVVHKDSNRLGDVIRFEDPSVTAQLWEAIFTRYRRILMLVLPVLRDLAEDDHSAWSTRVLAAQIIGRIGELDPARIALPIIHTWAASGDLALRPLVGRVVQGALASGNENYRNVALRNIEWLADAKATGDGGEAKDGLLTAVGAYAQIGRYEPALAMERLGAIVSDYLAPIFDDFHKSARDAETVQTELLRTRSNHAAELHRRRLQLSTFATNLFAENAPALIAIGQTVSQLCLAHDPIQILRSMRDWIAKGGPRTGVLVSLLFLRGIVIDLQAMPAGIRAMTGGSGSPLLLSLAMAKDAVHHLCAFLADIHASINTTFILPAWLQHDSQEKFAECLTTWAREAVSNNDHRQNIQDLFVALAVARSGSMRRDLLAILESTAFTGTESMRSFANQVRKRMAT